MRSNKNLMRIRTLVLTTFTIGMVPQATAMVVRHDVDPNAFIVDAADHPAVFPLSWTIDGQGDCAGTLIAPQWVVTAAHCFPVIAVGGDIEIAGHRATIDLMVVHPNYEREFRLPDDLAYLADADSVFDVDPRFDIGLIRLSEPVTHVDPLPVYRGDSEEGMVFEMVGWGMQGTGDKGIGSLSNLIGRTPAQRTTNTVDRVDETTLYFDFDGPGDPTVTPLEGVSGPGDSGGPAIASFNDTAYIIGISSGGFYPEALVDESVEGRYGWLEYYTRVSAVVAWIDAETGTHYSD